MEKTHNLALGRSTRIHKYYAPYLSQSTRQYFGINQPRRLILDCSALSARPQYGLAPSVRVRHRIMPACASHKIVRSRSQFGMSKVLEVAICGSHRASRSHIHAQYRCYNSNFKVEFSKRAAFWTIIISRYGSLSVNLTIFNDKPELGDAK